MPSNLTKKVSGQEKLELEDLLVFIGLESLGTMVGHLF